MADFQTVLRELELDLKNFLLSYKQLDKSNPQFETLKEKAQQFSVLYKLISTYSKKFPESDTKLDTSDNQALFNEKLAAFKKNFEAFKSKIENDQELSTLFSNSIKS